MKISIALLFIVFSLFSREKNQLGENNEISILSDKAYRYADKDLFEAVGNVIITRENDTLYGESAKLNMNEQIIHVDGSVRFTTNNITMYGTKLSYKLDSTSLTIENARVLSQEFSIFGEKIERIEDSRIIATNAEYTSCRDCPESWSVFGSKVDIQLGEYVRVSGAIFKINNVPMIYIPFFIFPIKNDRQTGLLFPELYSSSTIDGVTFKQPFFWAINQSRDMTIAPSFFGNRGPGLDLEYRHVLGEGKWFQIEGLGLLDRKYNPGYIRGENREINSSRYFGTYEHKYEMGLWGNHHFIHQSGRDYDFIRDFQTETDDEYNGNDLGTSSFFEYRHNLFHTAIEGHFRDNLIVQDPLEFDHSYVQVLPKTYFTMTPQNIFNSDTMFFKSLDINFSSDYTIFKQNHISTPNPTSFRNAKRVNLNPRVNWNLGHVGPMRVNSSLVTDYQNYEFNKSIERPHFEKWASLVQTEFTLEIDRIYGLAYQQKIPKSRVTLKKAQVKKKEDIVTDTIGALPEFENELADDFVTLNKKSYRHSQEFKFIHYKVLDSNESGNAVFGGQIDNQEGQFDYIDVRRERESDVASSDSQKELRKIDTIEFRWNNSLIRKTKKGSVFDEDGKFLKDHFDYNNVFSFNISQGLDVSSDSTRADDFKSKLSRLKISTSFNFHPFSITSEEFYFYNGSHIYNLSTSYRSDFIDLNAGFSYNSVDTSLPTNTAVFGFIFRPSDIFTFRGKFDIDLRSQQENNKESYEIRYSPPNNCWTFDLEYSDDSIETRYSFDFNFLFNSDFSRLF